MPKAVIFSIQFGLLLKLTFSQCFRLAISAVFGDLLNSLFLYCLKKGSYKIVTNTNISLKLYVKERDNYLQTVSIYGRVSNLHLRTT